MEKFMFGKKEHFERLDKLKDILEKIIDKRKISYNGLYREAQINIFYMEDFLEGKNPNFPNPNKLKNLADLSEGVTTYEELMNICGHNRINYMKQVNPEKEILRGDIMWCKLPEGVGSEQGGTRPVIIISNNLGNKHSQIVTICPITSQINKAKLPTHVEIGQSCGLEKSSIIMFEQQRVVDKSRLGDYIGRVSGRETINRINTSYKIAGGCYTFSDQLLEKLETVDETSKTQLGVFKKLFNILLNKYKNKELVFSNNRTA